MVTYAATNKVSIKQQNGRRGLVLSIFRGQYRELKRVSYDTIISCSVLPQMAY